LRSLVQEFTESHLAATIRPLANSPEALTTGDRQMIGSTMVGQLGTNSDIVTVRVSPKTGFRKSSKRFITEEMRREPALWLDLPQCAIDLSGRFYCTTPVGIADIVLVVVSPGGRVTADHVPGEAGGYHGSLPIEEGFRIIGGTPVGEGLGGWGNPWPGIVSNYERLATRQGDGPIG
jgi:hypothetical protein